MGAAGREASDKMDEPKMCASCDIQVEKLSLVVDGFVASEVRVTATALRQL